MQNTTYSWYQLLKKPSWAPPAWVFGPVWTILYAIIAMTYGWVFVKLLNKELPFKIALPFMLNLLFNFSYTTLQFRLHNNLLAAIDIVLILATLIWALVAIFPYAAWITYANIPYALWVAFATVLQFTITYMNWKYV